MWWWWCEQEIAEGFLEGANQMDGKADITSFIAKWLVAFLSALWQGQGHSAKETQESRGD
jgi:hypothetical protein